MRIQLSVSPDELQHLTDVMEFAKYATADIAYSEMHDQLATRLRKLNDYSGMMGGEEHADNHARN